MDELSQTDRPEKPVVVRDDDFASLYANNVLLETSIWDLKMIFGQLDQFQGGAKISLHTAISLPWLQAKLMSHVLLVNLALYEAQNGKIKIPERLIPGVLPIRPDEDEEARSQRELVNGMREHFIAGL